jgi:hypothetical protein
MKRPRGSSLPVHPEKPSWILVRGSTAPAIQKAVIEHSGLARHVLPTAHRVSVFQIDGDRYGVLFDPPIPPYAFTNLIGWLDDAKMTSGAVGAVGWLTAPGTRIRYFLAPEKANSGGDTLVGVGTDGTCVSVFLPDCGVSRTTKRTATVPEPDLPLQRMQPVAEFEITVDSDKSFGNPEFAV